MTAREHFICHWLLVKIYKKNSNERIKMIWVFHRMCFSSTGGRITNSKAFEKYKIEFYENAPGAITWARRGNHVGPQGKSRGPPGAITWAPRGNHVGPQGQSRGPPGEITWAPRGNHVGPHGQSRRPPGAITWAPGGNHVGPQVKALLTTICEGRPFTAEDVTHGRIGYYSADKLSFSPTTDDGKFAYLTMTPAQFAEAGFTFDPAIGPSQGVDFVCNLTNGAWRQVDVQPKPVTSVNGRTGDVLINYSDVGAVQANEAITAGTHSKITYDAKGLVTAGEDIELNDVADVTITNAANNDFLLFSETLSKWINFQLTEIDGGHAGTGPVPPVPPTPENPDGGDSSTTLFTYSLNGGDSTNF